MLDGDTVPLPEGVPNCDWEGFFRQQATVQSDSDDEHIPEPLLTPYPYSVTPYPASVEHIISHHPPTPDSPFIPEPPQGPWDGWLPPLVSPVYQHHQHQYISHRYSEEGGDHFVRRWQKW